MEWRRVDVDATFAGNPAPLQPPPGLVLVSVICPDCKDRRVAAVEDTENGLALKSYWREPKREQTRERRVTPVTVVPAAADDPSYWHGVSFTASPDDLPLALECPKHGKHLTLTLGEVRGAASRALARGRPTRLAARRR